MKNQHKKFVSLFGENYRETFQTENLRQLFTRPNVGRVTVKAVAEFMERESLPQTSHCRMRLAPCQLPSWIEQSGIDDALIRVYANSSAGAKSREPLVELNACGQNKLTDRLAEAALAFATGLLSRVNSRVSIDEISLSYRRRYASEIQEPLQYTLALRTPETTDFVELSAKIESALNAKTLRVKATKCDTDLRNVIVYSLPEGVPYEDKVIWEPLVLSVRLP